MTDPICPDCRAPIDGACVGCGRSVPVVRGIPDLVAVEDGYLSSAEDLALASRLDEVFDSVDFPTLLSRYLEWAGVPERARPGQIAHILAAGGRAEAWLDLLPPDGPILDLGCGAGGFAAAVGPRRTVVGCDIALRWLLVARKRLDALGLGEVRLARASSERLPWPDEAFTGIVAGDVIEHVSDQARTLAEAHRVLRPGGVLVMTTPNRRSLGPEPHVGLLGIGYLPRSWMSRYARLRGRGDYRAVRNNGPLEWRRILQASPFRETSIVAPELREEDLMFMSRPKRAAARVYNRFARTSLARVVGPTFRIVCRK